MVVASITVTIIIIAILITVIVSGCHPAPTSGPEQGDNNAALAAAQGKQ